MNVIDQLFEAIIENNTCLIEWLLAHKVSVNATNEEKDTTLHIAACEGNQAAVGILLNKGAGVREKNIFGNTPLQESAREGHCEIVAMLLRKDADVHSANYQLNTSLHEAAAMGHLDVVELLLNNGADINIQNKEGETPLHQAAYQDHRAVVAMLLKRGASPHIRSLEQITALHEAAFAGNLEVVQLLLENGALPNNHQLEETPLHKAAYMKHKAVVKLLLKNNAIIDSQNELGDTPLHEAALKGSQEIFTLLVKAGASLTIKNNQGHTPLHKAAYGKHKTIMQTLLESGVYTYTHRKVDFIIEQCWENLSIRSDADRPFYITLLLSGVDTHNKRLPNPLDTMQRAVEAIVFTWLAPLALSEATCREITPRVLRALPRLIHWVHLISYAEKIRSQEKGALKDTYVTLEDYIEGLKHLLLMTKSEEEQAKDALHLDIDQQATLKQLKVTQVPLEIMEMIRAQLVIKVLADTLTRIYSLPPFVANYLAREGLAYPHQYLEFYRRLKQHHRLTDCTPPVAYQISTVSSTSTLQAQLGFPNQLPTVLQGSV